MNDLGTGAEHMDRQYLWRANKRGHRVHIENPETARTFCQVENCGGKPFDDRGSEIPSGRRICGNCVDLASRDKTDYREPSLAVLLGERLAETEPGLFDGNDTTPSLRTPNHPIARKPWKRAEQARPVNRSKAHKPNRSTVKHPRPFNDDLPW